MKKITALQWLWLYNVVGFIVMAALVSTFNLAPEASSTVQSAEEQKPAAEITNETKPDASPDLTKPLWIKADQIICPTTDELSAAEQGATSSCMATSKPLPAYVLGTGSFPWQQLHVRIGDQSGYSDGWVEASALTNTPP